MTLHTSPAIILRTWDFGESDLMVSFFTPTGGRLKAVAKGARRSRARFANCLDLLCLTRLEYERRKEEGPYFLISGKLMHAFPGLRSGFLTLSLASYMVELTELLFPIGVAAERMFELLRGALSILDEQKEIDAIRVLFEAKAMALGGYGIDLTRCCMCGRAYRGEGRAVFKEGSGGIACLRCAPESGNTTALGPAAAKALHAAQATPWDARQVLGLTAEMICEMKPVMRRHIDYRIGQRLKSREFLSD